MSEVGREGGEEGKVRREEGKVRREEASEEILPNIYLFKKRVEGESRVPMASNRRLTFLMHSMYPRDSSLAMHDPKEPTPGKIIFSA